MANTDTRGSGGAGEAHRSEYHEGPARAARGESSLITTVDKNTRVTIGMMIAIAGILLTLGFFVDARMQRGEDRDETRHAKTINKIEDLALKVETKLAGIRTQVDETATELKDRVRELEFTVRQFDERSQERMTRTIFRLWLAEFEKANRDKGIVCPELPKP